MASLRKVLAIFKNTKVVSFQNRNFAYHIAVSPDKSMILCHHPPKSFPYECTKPIIRSEEAMKEEGSMLDGRWVEGDGNGPTNQEIMSMFHITRHPLDPKVVDKFRKKVGKERKAV